MSESCQSPTIRQVKAAGRLMAQANLDSVRLLQASAAYFPPAGGGATGPEKAKHSLCADVDAVPRARIENDDKLKVHVKYRLRATRGTSPQSQLALRVSVLLELNYTLPQGLRPSSNEVSAFSKTNAMLNSWPYWREFVQNTVARMNLPPLTLPLFRLVPPVQKGKQP